MLQIGANKVLIDSPWKSTYRPRLNLPGTPRGLAQSHGAPPRCLVWPRCQEEHRRSQLGRHVNAAGGVLTCGSIQGKVRGEKYNSNELIKNTD